MTTHCRLTTLVLIVTVIALSQALAAPLTTEQRQKAEYAYVQHEMSDTQFKSIYDREARTTQSFNRHAAILETDRDSTDVVLRRVRALADDIKSAVPSAMLTQLANLEDRNAKADLNDSGARFRLFRDTVSLRDRIALCNPLLNFDKLLFIKRHYGKYAHMCDQYFGYHARHGGSLFVLDRPFSSTPVLRDLLKDTMVESGRLQGQKLRGSLLSPELSYDGKTIV
ncbi:MAG: hypothetical protein GY809_02615, partial [Planctomycetes bacterium]|nr:hypothetical protein [Planctomycetota bacterium]